MKIAVCYMGKSAKTHARHIAQVLQEHTQATEVVVYNKPVLEPNHPCRELEEWGPDVVVFVERRRG